MSAVQQKIAKVIHQTFITTDEKGSEAAAATVVKMMVGASAKPPTPFQFTADHPFFFTIQNNSDNSIIFMGEVRDPSQS
jgi:serpin B